MPLNPLGPVTPAAHASPMLDAPERTLPGRRLGVVLALIALSPFPFVQITSCNGGAAVSTSGLEMFTHSTELAIWTPLVLAAILGLAWWAARLTTPGRRLVAGLLEWLAVGGLFVVVEGALFSVGFFDKVEGLPAGYAAGLLFLGLVIDVTVTLGLRGWHFTQSIRRARNQSSAVSRAGSSGPMT